ncbi:uncharacterized protein PF3D7_1120600-like [Chironomus tepperi]|uniref:uncharacterized protein PF3D7_1120600-like n=1 Tax=Chironomus tepperi TaxID=113505 RepID=UPI00391F5B07
MELHCIFYSQNFDASYNVYRCLITNREIPFDKELKLIGRHESNKINDNVTHVEFNNCTIRKIPQNLCKIFPNLKVLKILNSELRKLSKSDLDGYEKLERLIFDFNEIEFLAGNLFENFKKLELISFRGNELKVIEPNILDGLDRLQHVDYRDNPNYSNCYSILSCKDSNAELEDVKVQIVDKFFSSDAEIVQKFVKKLQNPMEQLKIYENLSKDSNVKLTILNLKSQIYEELTNRKIEHFRTSESNLNQEIKNFINFESKLIREINALRNFEGKLTQEIQDLKRANPGPILIRQQSEPVYDNSVAALRQELQSWRSLANKLSQEVQKLKNSESKLILEVQNLKIRLEVADLRKAEDSVTFEALAESPGTDQTSLQPENSNRTSNQLHRPELSHKSHQKPLKTPQNPKNSFLIDIKKYIQDEITKDFIIKIDNQEFLVHKFLLAARSPTLADILNKNPFIDSLNLESITIESFQHILRFIYIDELPSEEQTDYVNLFEAAGLLQIEELKDYAGRKVLDKLNADNAIEIFNLSSKYEHKMLRQKSFEEIKKNYES